MSATSIVVIAALVWLVAMAASWSMRWMNALSAMIAVGIAVSWQRVDQYHARKSGETAFYNRPAPSPVSPPPDHSREGT